MLDKVKINDLITISGRTYLKFKKQDVYLVLDKVESENSYSLLLLRESGDTFWSYWEKSYKQYIKSDIHILQ
ncbi:MAG: hypothetical protein EBY39_11865 [Flavobacteriia bacterium]|nr:hypothetical protein [Flavobacteriia bacterium]